jgi:peptidoglycan/LPS O-acetylase OafA/YrhL
VDLPKVRYLSLDETVRLVNACAPDFGLLVQAALFTGCRYRELVCMACHDFNPDAGYITVLGKSSRTRHVPLTDESQQFFKRVIAGELWFASIRPFSNGPYWSLGYEFWYYVLYGVAFYCAGYVRGVLIALIVLVIGPKIMLLFPVWLMGVWTYRFNKERTLPGAVGWICVVLPTAIYLWIKLGGIDILARDLSMEVLGEDFVKRELKYSDEFLISYVYGALIAASFIGMNAIAPLLEKAFARFEKSIRFWAGLTFSIYLLHYPLLHFFGALYGGEVSALSTQLLIVASTLSAIVLIGAVTERKKHVARRVIAALFTWAEPRRATSL